MKASHQAWQQALRSASVSRSPALLGPASESGNVVVGRGSQCPTHGVKSPTRRSKGLLTRPSATCCKMNSNCAAALHDCLEQFSSILPLRELHSHGDAPGPASAASAVPCPACCSLFALLLLLVLRLALLLLLFLLRLALFVHLPLLHKEVSLLRCGLVLLPLVLLILI